MKKIFVLLTVLTLTIMSCKNETKTEPTSKVVDSTAVATDSVAIDSVEVETTEEVVEEKK
jgi:PBP1b-binding outer membrane lipoprotein LpoB